MNTLLLYFITILGNLNVLFFILCLFFTVFSIGFLCIMVEQQKSYDKCGTFEFVLLFFFVVGFLFSAVTYTLLPSKTQMIDLYVIPLITRNESVEKLPDNILTHMEKYYFNNIEK
jgi:phosphatidylglycerophosphate synthase